MAGPGLGGRLLVILGMLPVLTAAGIRAEQAALTSLRGKVLDPALAGVANARVTAARPGGAPGFTALSGQEGDFSIELPVGRYAIEIVARGFQKASRVVSLPPPEGAVQTFVLQIETRRDTVTVTDRGAYAVSSVISATKTATPLIDLPQSVTVVTRELVHDQLMTDLGAVVRYVPGVTAHQGENNRDQLVFRGNSSSADFFLNGMRDDAQYYRDLYNLERLEALKGPNAMIFGRGGGGGVINRVTKEAGFFTLREIALQGGTNGNKRFALDLDHPIGTSLALRLNGMYENSGSFRDYAGLWRSGFNPTATILARKQTKITLSYEHLRDRRVADRGIPSFRGRPADIPIATFFGNPDQSHVRALVDLGSAALEHHTGKLVLRSRTLIGNYDRWYQNFVPGAVTGDGMLVSMSAYSNATVRRNAFNQTDVTYPLTTGRIRHTLLAGIEVSRQLTDNLRKTGYFDDATTSVTVPLSDPLVPRRTSFRQSPTDADNNVKADVAAVYAQDQLQLHRSVQLIAGVRFDRFDLRYRNNRSRDELRRVDRFVSPRAGLVYKPLAELSIYGSYSVSSLPSAGDQFSSLTAVTQQMKPEKFINYEVGVKWDASRSLSFTAAAYRLDRSNTRATDPSDPARIVQTGSQRSNGFEVGVNGSPTRAWNIVGGLAFQDSFIVSATAAAAAGSRVPQAPRAVVSIWNHYQLRPRLGLGLGILNRSDMFAAIDNTVVLPGYTRADAALFLALAETVRLQINVENVLGTRYYVNANSNNNISPGYPRAVRAALVTRF